jgi:hypothetical protein
MCGSRVTWVKAVRLLTEAKSNYENDFLNFFSESKLIFLSLHLFITLLHFALKLSIFVWQFPFPDIVCQHSLVEEH